MTVRERNTEIWQDYTDFAYRGIDNPLQSYEETVNLLGESFIEGAIFIVDDKNRIKLEQLADMIQLGNDQIANERAIVDSKAETRRIVMALESATNDYIMIIARYVTEVKSQIMDARILALEMSENEITLAGRRAALAEERADIKIQEIDLQIQLEGIERKHVEIEKLRAELSVAKANVAVIMAEIDVTEAELAVINGRVQKAMAEIEKIELTVEVAKVLADLIVRQIAGVRLESERADLEAIADVIAIKLAAILALIDKRIENVRERTGDEKNLLEVLKQLQVANLDEQQIWLERAASDETIQTFKEGATDDFLEALRKIEELVTEWAIKWIEESNKDKSEIYIQQARDAALTNQATAEGYMRQHRKTYTSRTLSQKIIKGATSLGGSCGGGMVPGDDDNDWEVDIE